MVGNIDSHRRDLENAEEYIMNQISLRGCAVVALLAHGI
jgi:hypothetical protein